MRGLGTFAAFDCADAAKRDKLVNELRILGVESGMTPSPLTSLFFFFLFLFFIPTIFLAVYIYPCLLVFHSISVFASNFISIFMV